MFTYGHHISHIRKDTDKVDSFQERATLMVKGLESILYEEELRELSD